MIHYKSPLSNAYGRLEIHKIGMQYYLVLDDYVGGDRVKISKNFADIFIQEMEK